MSKISKAMDRARREQQLPAGEPAATEVVRGASRAGQPALPASDAEEYRTLASEIYLALPELGSRVVMFVSAVGGEGTSTVAREFSAAMATDNEVETLLVDANLRRPVLHDAFRVSRDPGIADYVLADAALSECLRDVRIPHLTLLPAGRPVVAPPRVFADPKVDGLLAELRKRFPCIVLDGPPLLSFSEGVQLSRKADGVIVVIRSGRTKRELVQRGLELLGDARASVLGTVLNGRSFHIPRFIYERL